MAFISGDVIGFDNFTTIIKNALTSNGWTNLKDGITGTRELFFQNQAQSVIIGFKQSMSGFSYANLLLNVCDTYISGSTFFAQAGSVNTTTSNTVLAVSDNYIKYWINVNDRRIIIACYTDQTYTVAYLGLYLPNGSTTVIPKPYFCGGTGSSTSASTSGLKSPDNASVTNFFEYANNAHSDNTINRQCQFKNNLNEWVYTGQGYSGSSVAQGTIFPPPYAFYYQRSQGVIIPTYNYTLYHGEYILGYLDGLVAIEDNNKYWPETSFKDLSNIEYICLPHNLGNDRSLAARRAFFGIIKQ